MRRAVLWAFVLGVAVAGPARAEPVDPVRRDRDRAFEQVLLEYPTRGRGGLLDEAQACYRDAAGIDAVRSCYLLDRTTRMVDLHVSTVRARRALSSGDLKAADQAALDRLTATGTDAAEAQALLRRWAAGASDDVTAEQRQELFAMLHDG